ncbi:MAG: hypothetical protein IJ709_14575 [Selenomonas sp.]|nr:hypothetical protein [Selenomonas sp.]
MNRKKCFGVGGMLILGTLSLMCLSGSTKNGAEENSLVQIEQNESKPQNIQLVQFGQVETPNVDMSVNPFVETAAETGAKNSTTGKSNGNYRNLPAIPAVYPTAQPRPVLPLPSIPRTAPQQQAVAVSASAQASAGEAAPKENKEAQIAFLGGGDIMFAHGMESGN